MHNGESWKILPYIVQRLFLEDPAMKCTAVYLERSCHTIYNNGDSRKILSYNVQRLIAPPRFGLDRHDNLATHGSLSSCYAHTAAFTLFSISVRHTVNGSSTPFIIVLPSRTDQIDNDIYHLVPHLPLWEVAQNLHSTDPTHEACARSCRL